MLTKEQWNEVKEGVKQEFGAVEVPAATEPVQYCPECGLTFAECYASDRALCDRNNTDEATKGE